MEIKDSGNRQVFESGAVRDIQDGKGRCDLLPLDVMSKCFSGYKSEVTLLCIERFKDTGDTCFLYTCIESILGSAALYIGYSDLFLDLSKHFEEGAKKYSENNWKNGIPAKRYIDSAVRHYLKYLRGDDDEPHKRAFVWNIVCCIWTCEHIPDLNDYRKDNQDDKN